jgi:hypothetical protein
LQDNQFVDDVLEIIRGQFGVIDHENFVEEFFHPEKLDKFASEFIGFPAPDCEENGYTDEHEKRQPNKI